MGIACGDSVMKPCRTIFEIGTLPKMEQTNMKSLTFVI